MHLEVGNKAADVYWPHAHAGIMTSRQRPAVRDGDSGSLRARPAHAVEQRGLPRLRVLVLHGTERAQGELDAQSVLDSLLPP